MATTRMKLPTIFGVNPFTLADPTLQPRGLRSKPRPVAWRSRTGRDMGVQTALDAVRDAPGIVEAIRLADDLAFEAGRDPGVRTLRVLARRIQRRR